MSPEEALRDPYHRERRRLNELAQLCREMGIDIEPVRFAEHDDCEVCNGDEGPA